MLSPLRIFCALLLLFVAVELVASITLIVNSKSTYTGTTCGSSTKACKTFHKAIARAQDGDTISLLAGSHRIVSTATIDKLITLTIKGAGKTKTTIVLSDINQAGISFIRMNFTLFDLTIKGGSGLYVAATPRLDDDPDVFQEFEIYNVNFEDTMDEHALKVYASTSDSDSSKSSGVVRDCEFNRVSGAAAVLIQNNAHVEFSDCTWANNKDGALHFFGTRVDFRSPKVVVEDSLFVNNTANATVINGGEFDTEDELIFKGTIEFDNNDAEGLLGYDTGSDYTWGYRCDDCEMDSHSNRYQARCLRIYYGTTMNVSQFNSPPYFPEDADDDFCEDGEVIQAIERDVK
jgi:hypothetical protein